jgi:hypothetical protein
MINPTITLLTIIALLTSIGFLGKEVGVGNTGVSVFSGVRLIFITADISGVLVSIIE